MRRRKVTGVEALVRWRHPDRGMLPPDLFIPMAEETGHIRALTEWVLAQAIARPGGVAEAGHDAGHVGEHLRAAAGRPRLRRLRAGRGGAAAKGGLCFEITETAVIENPESPWR